MICAALRSLPNILTNTMDYKESLNLRSHENTKAAIKLPKQWFIVLLRQSRVSETMIQAWWL